MSSPPPAPPDSPNPPPSSPLHLPPSSPPPPNTPLSHTPPAGIQLYGEVSSSLARISKVGWQSAVDTLTLSSSYYPTCPHARLFAQTHAYQIIAILLDQETFKISNFEAQCVVQSLTMATQLVLNCLRCATKEKEEGSVHFAFTPAGLGCCLTELFRPTRFFYTKRSTCNNAPNPRTALVNLFHEHGGFGMLLEYWKTRGYGLDPAPGIAPDGPEDDSLERRVESIKITILALKEVRKEEGENPDPDPSSSTPSLPAASTSSTDTQGDTSASSSASSSPLPDALVSPATITVGSTTNPITINLPPPPHLSPKTPARSLLPQYLTHLQSSILALSPDALRTLHTPSNALNSLLIVLPTIYPTPIPPTSYYTTFLFPFLKTLLTSTTLSLRLAGYSHITQLIPVFEVARPPPRRYEVSGSGTSWVDGFYEYCNNKSGPSYVLVTTVPGSDKSVTLTLFRCQMRSNCRWWFISHADPAQPGTDKDVDYYQHKSMKHQESQPPATGWIVSKGKGGALAPAPALTPIGVVTEPGMEERTHEHVFANWLTEADILSCIFDTSTLHREVINRAPAVLNFMSANRQLNTTHVTTIWNTTVSDATSPIESESLHKLLSSLLPELDEALTAHLIQTLTSSLLTPASLPHVSSFLAQVATANPTLTPKSLRILLDLLYAVLTLPSVSAATKWYAPLITYFLQTLQSQPDSVKAEFIDKVATSLHYTSALHILALTNSLLSLVDSTMLPSHLETLQLPERLFKELTRFLTKATPNTPRAALTKRLDILRRVGSCANISFEQIEEIWGLSKTSDAKEQLLEFLASACGFDEVHGAQDSTSVYSDDATTYGPATNTPSESSRPALSIDTAKRAFTNLVCQSTDWASLSMTSYIAFKQMLEGLTAMDLEVASLARSCLWKISLQATADDVANSAGQHLLELVRVSGSPEEFLTQVISAMEANLSDPSAVSRCAKLLNLAVEEEATAGTALAVKLESTATLTPSEAANIIATTPHGLRGQSSFIAVTVIGKKISSNNHNRDSMMGNSGSSGNNSRFTLNVHPLESLESLRVKTAAVADFPLNLIRPMNVRTTSSHAVTGLTSVNTNTVLAELDVTENAEITMLFGVNAMGSVNRVRQLPTEKLPFDIGGVFSSAFFESLVGAMESADAVTQKLISKFLDAVPTNEATLAKVMSAASPADWSALLNAMSYQRSVYTLQVIDAALQPAGALYLHCPPGTLDAALQTSAEFKQSFIASGGFAALLSFFCASPVGDAAALRIIKHCLESTEGLLASHLSDPKPLLANLASTALTTNSDTVILDALTMLRLLFQSSPLLVEHFVTLPKDTAKQLVLTLLFRTGGDNVKSTVAGRKVRLAMLSTLMDVPQWSAVVLGWLVAKLPTLQYDNDCVNEYFTVLKKLVMGSEGTRPAPKLLKELGSVVCQKLAAVPRTGNEAPTGVLCGCLSLIRHLLETTVDGGGEQALGNGCKLIAKGFAGNSKAKASVLTPLATLSTIIFEEFLFSSGKQKPICTSPNPRQKAFQVLAACARVDNEGQNSFSSVIDRMQSLIDLGSPPLRNKWGYQVQLDGKNDAAVFAGLRNQGCTCYMNSLLQQLFMMKSLRQQLLDAPIDPKLRGVGNPLEKSGSYLIGKRLSILWENGTSYECECIAYDSATGMHQVRYKEQDQPPASVDRNNYGSHSQQQGHDSLEEFGVAQRLDEVDVELFLSEGRNGRETGTFQILAGGGAQGGGGMAGGEGSEEERGVPASPTAPEETDADAAARRMLEELQRTFVYLETSKKRYFDPRSLVEASNCLRLEYDVWQQNDASEYQTKLLDMLEIGLKKHAPRQMKHLNDVFQTGICKQKICKECGLKTNREEIAVNLEGPVRGRSSLSELIQGYCSEELMDGDNKIECDTCDKRTTTVLRTCINKLPQILTISLKRFDLDYNTFETVKLNSRLEFGQELNMKRYTLKGFDVMDKHLEMLAAEGSGDEGGDEGGGDDPATPTRMRRVSSVGSVGGFDTPNRGDTDRVEEDPLDVLPDEEYMYELAGVLVHAGVAQGGHYYSYIKDRDEGSWFKFDDEDVSPFDLSGMERECFGGKVMKETKYPNGQVHTVEQESFANALMLFYEKKVKVEGIEEGGKSDGGLVEGGGLEAYSKAVDKANDTHVRHSFLLDDELQNFLKGLLVSKTAPPSKKTLAMCVNFFFDILLHSSLSVKALKSWEDALTFALSTSAEGALAFVTQLADRTKSLSGNWLKQCACENNDASCRLAAFNVIAAAIGKAAMMPDEEAKLTVWKVAWEKQTNRLLMNLRETKNAIPCVLEGVYEQYENYSGGAGSCLGVLVGYLSHLLDLCPTYWKNSGELLHLVRSCSVSCGKGVRDAMVASHVPARLACLVTREASPKILKVAYPGCCISNEGVELMRGGGVGGVGQHGQFGHQMVGAMGTGNNMNWGAGMDSNVGDPNLVLVEAIAGLLDVPGVKRADILVESGGSRAATLTAAAEAAFTVMFNSCITGGKPGMDVTAINACMNLCGIQAGDVHAFQIQSILHKYETVAGEGGEKFLSLKGFCDYHRDTSSNSETQVRADLTTFGFRLDLTRREGVEVTGTAEENGDVTLTVSKSKYEAIGEDVGAVEERGRVELGDLGEVALGNMGWYKQALNIDESLGAGILAAVVWKRDSRSLINDILQKLAANIAQWNSSDTVSLASGLFRTLAAIPDEMQLDRIQLICQSTETAVENKDLTVGLFAAARAYAMNASRFGASSDTAFKYINILKHLLDNRVVTEYLNHESREQAWAWTKNWFEDDRVGQAGGTGGKVGVGKGVVVGRVYGGGVGTEVGVDSDEEGELGILVVEGCGVDAINGRWRGVGLYDDVGRWQKDGFDGHNECTFTVFRCRMNDGQRRWYVSVVPVGSQPGTRSDVDYYQCSEEGNVGHYGLEGGGLAPPGLGWSTCKNNGRGVDPAPTMRVLSIARKVGALDDDDEPPSLIDGVGDMDVDDPPDLGYI